MGWLTGPSQQQLELERKTIGLQIPTGDQHVIQIDPFGGGRPNLDGMLYPDSAYETLARNGYGRNELVYACIAEKATSMPEGILRVWPAASGEPLADHRLRRLLANPNPVTSEFEFWELTVTYLDLAGNSYWLIQRAIDGLPAELWPLRPDLVRILPTANPRVWHYGYIVDPTTGVRGRPPEVIPVDRRDIIHVKYPNPLDAYFGQAPLRPATRAVTLDNAATDFVDTLLRNHAIPGLVVETESEITETIATRLKAKWREAFGGTRRGEPAFLQKGMTVKPLGLNLRDLEFPDLRTISESRICMALGVPPILVGAKVGLDRSTTYGNYKEARASLWEETLLPLQHRFLGPVATRLLPEFSGVGRARVQVRWDNSGVLALKEAESARWERATNALARGGITINDFRRTVGLDPVDAGEVFLLPAGVVAQPADRIQALEPDQGQHQPAELVAASLSYADRFLAEHKQRAAATASERNGHRQLAGVGNGS